MQFGSKCALFQCQNVSRANQRNENESDLLINTHSVPNYAKHWIWKRESCGAPMHWQILTKAADKADRIFFMYNFSIIISSTTE